METANNNNNFDKKDQSEDIFDSPVNTRPAMGENDNLESLTPDEDAGTDPNEVPDKPSFNRDNEDSQNTTGTFDGEIGI
ncbi:MAG TPA: hypothetical protein VGB50_01190 [Flavobacterium sp.]|jgi:hypothetical protein